MNLSQQTKLTMVKDLTTNGTGAVESAAVDMAGYDGVIFFGKIATANAGNFAVASQDAVVGGSYSDLAGSKSTPAENGHAFFIDVYKPTKQFVRCEVTRAGATTVLGEIYALQYRARTDPSAHGTTITAPVVLAGPDEGTP